MANKLTKEQWKEIEEKLQSFYQHVDLLIDGFNVSLKLTRISAYKNVIEVFVNGKWKGKWLVDDTEEQQRFYPRREVYLWSAKLRKDMIKIIGKRKAIKEGYLKKQTKLDIHWKSFQLLKSHFIKHNESIVLVEKKSTLEKIISAADVNKTIVT